MPEARDRLLRPGNDAEEMFKRRRRSSGTILIQSDESPLVNTGTASQGPSGAAATPARGRGRSRSRLRRNLYRYSGGENREAGRRVSRRVLPYWYPRKPLQDITTVVRVSFYKLLVLSVIRVRHLFFCGVVSDYLNLRKLLFSGKIKLY